MLLDSQLGLARARTRANACRTYTRRGEGWRVAGAWRRCFLHGGSRGRDLCAGLQCDLHTTRAPMLCKPCAGSNTGLSTEAGVEPDASMQPAAWAPSSRGVAKHARVGGARVGPPCLLGEANLRGCRRRFDLRRKGKQPRRAANSKRSCRAVSMQRFPSAADRASPGGGASCRAAVLYEDRGDRG